MKNRLCRLPVVLASVLTAIALLGPTLGSSAAAASTSTKLDPNLPIQAYLQLGALVNPSQSVKVIVRKSSALVDSRLIAAAVGATVIEEFGFIQSFELALPVGQIATLIAVPGVQFVSFDGPVAGTAVDSSALQTTYPASIDAPQVWNASVPATGQGISVAVIDTGVNANHPDLVGRVTSVVVNSKASNTGDGDGHGTHVSGIIAGRDPQGRYIGVAPDAHVVSVKISDDSGNSSESDLIRGLAWVYTNRAAYGIRVVNVSAHALIQSSYLTSPVDAAVEALWQAGVVVVAAAGNDGSAHTAVWHAPGNDPFVISVGALDDNQTAAKADDTLANFSSRGRTIEFINKPDVVAPGRKIVAPLAGPNVNLARLMPNRISPDGRHIRLSGTSMATPVTAGTVALLLQRYPNLTPDQVKWVLLNSTRSYTGQSDNAGVIDAAIALQLAGAGSVGRANQGNVPSPGKAPGLVNGLLGLVTSVGVSLDTSAWDASAWDASAWDASAWDASAWDASAWDASAWDASAWDAAQPD